MFQETYGYVPSSVSSFILILNRGNFSPQGTFGHVQRHFCLSQLGMGQGRAMASSGQKPGLLLNLLHAHESLTTKDYLASKVNSAEGGKPCFNSPSPNVNSWPRSNQGKLSSIDLRASYFPEIAVLKVWARELLGDTANYSFL